MTNKILTFKSFQKILNNRNKRKKRILGMCHGVFDLLHIGHIYHFEEAKKKCDLLIVSITSDKYIFKGPGRPKFNENERMRAVASLSAVDYVIISDSLTAVKNINLIKPNLYFKGPDYKNNSNDYTKNISFEIKAIKKLRGKIIYTSGQKFSSSKLLNVYEAGYKNEDPILKKVRKKFIFSDIKKIITDFRSTKPFVLGETIIDEYIFCETLGKSGKEPILVIRDLSRDIYLGGAGAICNHLANFNNKVNFLTVIGSKKDYLGFIKKKLAKNVSFDFIKKKDSPTILKKRFVDDVSKSKILGVYSVNDDLICNKDQNLLTKKFKKKKMGLTILSDYGHGMFTKKFTDLIKSKSKFVSVNVQINAANSGHHSLENYKKIDFMIINEKELRHEMRSKSDKIKNLMKSLTKKLKLVYLVVTRGSSGSILYNSKTNQFHICGAYANKVIDKVGAGDAMLSILSVCLFKKIDIDLSLLIASFCAAQSVGTLGNSLSINQNILLKDLEYYLM